jgi:hypothetical protein
MWAIAARIAAYVLGAAVVIGGIYYGIDSIAGAFRDRTALQAKVEQDARDAERLKADVAAAEARAEQTRKEAETAAAAAKAELDLRDALAKKAAARETLIAKELKDATERLARWMHDAPPDLVHCLGMPVPDDDGVLAAGGQAGGAALHPGDARRVPDAAGGVPARH